jgi:hypothetical protein
MVARKYEGDYAARKRQAATAHKQRDVVRSRIQRNAACRRWKWNNVAQFLMGNMRAHAKKKGLECTISLEEMQELVEPMVCALTGWELRWEEGVVRDPLAPSPDRLDNALGYVAGNVRIVCWRVNKMRGTMTDKELLDVCQAILGKK